jgi:DNA-binding beta-propeller fold protein YncE
VRRNSFLCLTIVLMAVVAAISGCQISPRIIPGQPTPTPTATPGPTGSPTPTPTPTPIPPSAVGKLYVTDQDDNSILRFDNALSATGNQVPGAVIKGASTTLNKPQFVAFNGATDTLYVANVSNASVVVYDGVSTKNGDAPPTRIITGAASTPLVSPSSVALDTTRDLLYVADGAEIWVFSPASTANGSTQFSRDITVGFTIQQIFLDAANDRLYATDAANNAVDVFDNASQLNLITSATRSLNGNLTQLNQPAGVTIDPAGNLVVTNQGNGSITVYRDAATATGNQAPLAIISGAATTLQSPQQIIQNAATNEVYVADSSADEVAVFTGIAGLNGTPAPTRRIFGPSTGLTGTTTARGVALDPSR